MAGTATVARRARVLGRSLALAIAGATAAVTGAVGPLTTGAGAQPVTQTFNCTGAAQTFTVPDGFTEITIDASGAQGGTGNAETPANGGPGGPGGRAQATIAVTPGETLDVF